jgi:hypothetical protein
VIVSSEKPPWLQGCTYWLGYPSRCPSRWPRKQPPRVELALRYAIRGKYLANGGALAHTARIDELFAILNPSEDELAAIMRHAGKIRLSMERQLAG